MRMALALAILLAVLCAAVDADAGAGDAYLNMSRARRAPLLHHAHRIHADEDLESAAIWKRTHWREMQTIMRQEGPRGDVECCPSVTEMIASKGGRTLSGRYVELYEDGENKQQLYEISCAVDTVDKPCRFVDARLYNQSKCVQKYSYSYALVRDPAATEMPHRHRREGHFSMHGSGGWILDYIRVRSGCVCVITPPKAPPKRPKVTHRRHRQRKRLRRGDDDDET